MSTEQHFPKRGEFDYWYNEEPFTDIHEVLHILREESQVVGEELHLHPCPEYEWQWEVVTPWYTNGDSGGDRSGFHHYQITPELAERLVAEGLVEARRVKDWGSTRIVPDELVISAAGRQKFDEFEKEMRAKAESLLKPGVHTDLTGEIQYRGYRREGYRHGRLYYRFAMPSGGNCHVYPEEGKVLLPGEEETEKA